MQATPPARSLFDRHADERGTQIAQTPEQPEQFRIVAYFDRDVCSA